MEPFFQYLLYSLFISQMLSQDLEAFSRRFLHSSFHDLPKYLGFGGLAFHANMVAAQLSIPLPMTQPPFQWMSSVNRLSRYTFEVP